MEPGTIVKTIHQYSKTPLSDEDMQKLQEIADDYNSVKEYVYQRYGGIHSLSKIYPGYTVQNEMTQSGRRTELGLPSVYFYLAVFDALGDIKTQWTKVKSEILRRIVKNEEFTQEDRHYLRFVTKINACFSSILCGKKVEVPTEMETKYAQLLSEISDVEKLHNYLRRQVRKNLHKMHTDKADGFFIAERAYRYGQQHQGNDASYGIFIATKEKRQRVFIPLTDTNQYKKQLYIKLNLENNTVEIAIPKVLEIQSHDEYVNEVGLSVGIWQMFTTHEGHVYGEHLGELHTELVDFIKESNKTYRREKQNNPGRKKYQNKKARLEARIHDYINQELNRMLEMEQPKVFYLPKLPKSMSAGVNKNINYSLNVWQRGYIRKRFTQKCRENNIEIVEVIGKDISRECSRCGEQGTYVKDEFICSQCGYATDKKQNAAANALNRGKMGRRLNKTYPVSGNS